MSKRKAEGIPPDANKRLASQPKKRKEVFVILYFCEGQGNESRSEVKGVFKNLDDANKEAVAVSKLVFPSWNEAIEMGYFTDPSGPREKKFLYEGTELEDFDITMKVSGTGERTFMMEDGKWGVHKVSVSREQVQRRTKSTASEVELAANHPTETYGEADSHGMDSEDESRSGDPLETELESSHQEELSAPTLVCNACDKAASRTCAAIESQH